MRVLNDWDDVNMYTNFVPGFSSRLCTFLFAYCFPLLL